MSALEVVAQQTLENKNFNSRQNEQRRNQVVDNYGETDRIRLKKDGGSEPVPEEILRACFDMVYPIGKIVPSSKPLTFPYGTWEERDEGYYIGATKDSNKAGTTTEAGLPNITGEISGLNMRGSSSNVIRKNGAFSDSVRRTGAIIGCSGVVGDSITTINLDASNSNSIYGSSTTVTPKTYWAYVYERIA